MSFALSVLSLVVLIALCSNTISQVDVQELTQGISKFSSDIYEVTLHKLAMKFVLKLINIHRNVLNRRLAMVT